MKILFACSCLEPGLDGVGDYTRRLAARLNAQGHPCALLSISDYLVKKPTVCEFSYAGRTVPCLRLPGKESWPERLRQAMNFCEKFAPDWVSWQIVLYGFNRRGLSFGLGRRLREISGNYKTQIMFHEIWIGEAKQAPSKHKIVGKAQKLIIQDLLKKLRPLVVHTHMPLYQYLLGRLGYPVKILPLFGNIPIAVPRKSEWLKEKWPEGGLHFHAANRDSWWVFVVFGSIHPEWDAEDFRRRASAAARLAGKRCLFISIGRPGGAGERMLRALRQHEGNAWRVLSLGQQSEADVSQCLMAADFGVSAVQPENIFKSGTAAAMVEHGLPIVVSRPASRYSRCPPEVLSVGMRNVVRHFDLEAVKKTEARSLLPAVARQFVEDLKQANASFKSR